MSDSQPVEPWEAELESEIFAVRQWMVECEPEGLRYPVRARILGRLLDAAHAPAQPSEDVQPTKEQVERLVEAVQDILVRGAEIYAMTLCHVKYKDTCRICKLRAALAPWRKG